MFHMLVDLSYCLCIYCFSVKGFLVEYLCSTKEKQLPTTLIYTFTVHTGLYWVGRVVRDAASHHQWHYILVNILVRWWSQRQYNLFPIRKPELRARWRYYGELKKQKQKRMTLGQMPRKHKTPPEEVWKPSPRRQSGGRHWRETSTGRATKCGGALRYHRLQKKAPIMHKATSLDEPNPFYAHFDLLSEDQPLSVSPTDVRAKSVELKWDIPKPSSC